MDKPLCRLCRSRHYTWERHRWPTDTWPADDPTLVPIAEGRAGPVPQPAPTEAPAAKAAPNRPAEAPSKSLETEGRAIIDRTLELTMRAPATAEAEKRPLTTAERVGRWRRLHREEYNRRQREYRRAVRARRKEKGK